MTALSAREAYPLWAPHYDAETAVSHLENLVVASLGVRTAGLALIDVGCGTGRRLHDVDAAVAVGVDVVPSMLGRARRLHLLAAADACALPFDDASFDVVWCRLVIGHVRNIETAFAELSRVARAGGAVVVTDIAAAAVEAGHRRTFRDEHGVTREVEHFVHSNVDQARVARNVGLALERREDGLVGDEIRRFYDDAGRSRMFEAQRGLPLVTGTSWRKR